MSFAGVTFLAPIVLLGLITLPIVWWILRISPPKPREQIFPPLRILEGVQSDEETPSGTPLWLLLFRLLMVALAVFALAQPIIKTSTTETLSRNHWVSVLPEKHWKHLRHYSPSITSAHLKTLTSKQVQMSMS